MAKKSKIARNKQRQEVVDRYAAKRDMGMSHVCRAAFACILHLRIHCSSPRKAEPP